jgi:hypothetical protein
MKAILLLLGVFVLGDIHSQTATRQGEPQLIEAGQVSRIEKIKGKDCSIFTYTLSESNKTTTVRDDYHLGVFYFVSGKDCMECFSETFQTLQFTGEEFAPIPDRSFKKPIGRIRYHKSYDILTSGNMSIHQIYFWDDRGTQESSDDEFIGADFVIDSRDPEAITDINL